MKKLPISALFALIVLSGASLSAMEQPKPSAKNIHTIMLSSSVKLNKQGHFADTSGVKAFFKLATQNDNTFAKPLKVKTMAAELRTAHFATAQLFKVTCEDGKKYILKEIKKGPLEEVKRLERVRTSHRLAPYLGTNVHDNLRIVAPTKYRSYTHKGKPHIFVIMRQAQGMSLQELMKDFKRNPHDRVTQRIHAKAYYDLGAALARFYKAHGSLDKTVTHQDLHNGNIFYFEDGTHQVVSLIDNERMAYSLDKPRNISVDIGYLFITSPFVMEWSHTDFLKDFQADDWYAIIVPSFVLGFIRTYPKEKRVHAFKALRKQFLTWNSKVDKNHSRRFRSLIKAELIRLERQLVTERKTALHVAVCYPALAPLVHRMIFDEKTTALHTKDKDGNIPLHEAAYFGNCENLTLLLKAGSSVNAKNNDGETPIYKTRYNRNKNGNRYNKVISTLKKYGAH